MIADGAFKNVVGGTVSPMETSTMKRVAPGQAWYALGLAGWIRNRRNCPDCVGRLDVLVNNTAEQHQDGLEKVSAEHLERTFRTNVLSMFFLSKAASRFFLSRRHPSRTCRPARRLSTPCR